MNYSIVYTGENNTIRLNINGYSYTFYKDKPKTINKEIYDILIKRNDFIEPSKIQSEDQLKDQLENESDIIMHNVKNSNKIAIDESQYNKEED